MARLKNVALCALTLMMTTHANAQSMTSEKCQKWLRFATSTGGLLTDQLAVIRANGEFAFSWTDSAYKAQTPHQLFSASKAITATIAATAIQEGKLSLSDKLSKFFPVNQRTNPNHRREYQEVTIGQLISMTSGLKWKEDPSVPPREISVLPLLYSEGYRNATRYILGLDFAARPGRTWNYSSANADLVMAVLRKVYGHEYDEMPWKNLFQPLDINSARIEQDISGTYLGAAYIYLSAEDLARIGRLYLNDGVIHGKRVLPEGWLARARQPVPASVTRIKSLEDLKKEQPFSQTGLWLNTPVPGLGKPFANAPESTLVVSGLSGQWLVILPEQGLAIARTGHDKDQKAYSRMNAFITGAIACFAK